MTSALQTLIGAQDISLRRHGKSILDLDHYSLFSIIFFVYHFLIFAFLLKYP